MTVNSCCRCRTTENTQQHGCSHYFCSGCQEADGCPLCSKRNNCAICLSIIDSLVKKILACGHEFCNACIDRWLAAKHKCPICLATMKGSAGEVILCGFCKKPITAKHQFIKLDFKDVNYRGMIVTNSCRVHKECQTPFRAREEAEKRAGRGVEARSLEKLKFQCTLP